MRIGDFLFFSILSISTKAQIPVSQEPYHRVVFENEDVRILNVMLPPGDTTQYHIHSTPSVFIGLSTNRPGSQLFNQPPAQGLFIAGSVFFEDLSAPHTRIHRVWNKDSFMFHVMDVEILKPDRVLKHPVFKTAYTRLETDTTWVRIYKTILPKDAALTVHEADRRFLFVALNDTKVSVSINNKEKARFLSAGDFFWFSAGDKFTAMNREDAIATFALLEVN